MFSPNFESAQFLPLSSGLEFEAADIIIGKESIRRVHLKSRIGEEIVDLKGSLKGIVQPQL